MLDLKNNMISNLNGPPEAIVKWEVWFVTPFGVSSSFDAAVTRLLEADLDPQHTIIPVAVAIGPTNYEISTRS